MRKYSSSFDNRRGGRSIDVIFNKLPRVTKNPLIIAHKHNFFRARNALAIWFLRSARAKGENHFQALITACSTNVSCLHTRRFISAPYRVTRRREKMDFGKHDKSAHLMTKYKQHKWSHRPSSGL